MIGILRIILHEHHVTRPRSQPCDLLELMGVVEALPYGTISASAVPTQTPAILLPSSRPPHKQLVLKVGNSIKF